MSAAHTGVKLSEEHIRLKTEAVARTWRIIKPTGEVEIIKNLAKYCRENKTSKGKMMSRGFKVEKLEK